MESEMKKNPVHNLSRVAHSRFDEFKAFSLNLSKKFKGLVCSVLVVRPDVSDNSFSMMIVVDDLNNVVVGQQVSEVKAAASQIAYDSSFQITTDAMLASDIWGRFQARDKDIFQLMRDSLVIHDNGFFIPLQDLLVKGKVRPSKESVNIYFLKAERSVKTSNQHVSKAVIDLYWAVTDAAHAAVMVAGITPPSPKDLAEKVKQELVARNLIHKRCADIVSRFYEVAKQIMHRERWDIDGREFDSLLSDANFFIREIDSFVKEHVK